MNETKRALICDCGNDLFKLKQKYCEPSGQHEIKYIYQCTKCNKLHTIVEESVLCGEVRKVFVNGE